jgi:hypothetical protein
MTKEGTKHVDVSLNVNSLSIPANQRQDRESVAKIMHPRAVAI